jgi:hypothetical protein
VVVRLAMESLNVQSELMTSVGVPIQSVEVIPQFDHELQTPNPVYTNNHESFDNPHDCEPAAFQSAGFERCVGSANCERHV